MAIIRLKEIAYANQPVLTKASRQALQAKADAEGNIFTETYVKKEDVAEIELSSSSGTFTPELFNILTKNNLNKLVLNNIVYALGYRDNTTRRYTTDILDNLGNLQMIDVSLSTRKWQYRTVGNTALEQHIADTTVHTTQAEKDYWNNKITCAVDGEILILTKENI